MCAGAQEFNSMTQPKSYMMGLLGRAQVIVKFQSKLQVDIKILNFRQLDNIPAIKSVLYRTTFSELFKMSFRKFSQRALL